jgi:phage baseplate assembly protein V
MQGYRGLVKELKPGECKAKAILPDLDNLETDWLPVPQTFTHGARSWAMPRIGQQVYIFFLDDEHLDGLIFAGRYSQKDKAPEMDAPDLLWELEDGTRIHAAPGLIEIETPGDVKVKADGDIEAEADGAIKAKAQSIEAEATTTATIKALTITAEATANATIKAVAITLDAPAVTCTGSLTVAGGIMAGGGTMTATQALTITAPSITLNAPVTATDVTTPSANIGGKPFLAHIHTAPNGPTSPPI